MGEKKMKSILNTNKKRRGHKLSQLEAISAIGKAILQMFEENLNK